MAVQIPELPKGTMLYNVEVAYYGRSDPQRIGVRPILITGLQVWASCMEGDDTSAVAAVRSTLEKQHYELIRVLSADVVNGIGRELIINDPAVDMEMLERRLRPPAAAIGVHTHMAQGKNMALGVQLALQALPTLIQAAETAFGPGTGTQKHEAVVTAATLIATAGGAVATQNNPQFTGLFQLFSAVISGIISHRNAIAPPENTSSVSGLNQVPKTAVG
jgi:hypothetical protein